MFHHQKENNKDEQCKEILKALLNKKLDINLSTAQIDSVWNLADLMVDIASGEFKCQTCGGKSQIYAIDLGQ